jgi:TRAP-type C4-dicarboxylate transport system substrate-binding protein
MKRRLALVGVVVLTLSLMLGSAGLVPVPVAAQERAVVWNLPHVAAPSYYHTINLKAFAEKVKELSNGRMEIRVTPLPPSTRRRS